MVRFRDDISIFSSKVLLLAAVLAVGFLWVLIPFDRHAHSSAPSPTKLWSIDLSKDGDFKQRLSIEEVVLTPPSIRFLSNSKILCDFYSREIGVTDKQLPANSYHVLEIDANHATIDRKLDFIGFVDNYHIFPVADGGFLVFADDKLQKFNNQFAIESTYPTPRVKEQSYDHWLADVAPDGRTVLLYSHRSGEKQATWTWLRTTDLSVIKSLQAMAVGSIKGSGDAVIFARAGESELWRDGKTTVLCNLCVPWFLSSDMLFLDKQHSYAIQTISGKVLGTGDLDVEADNFTRSAQTTRIAFDTGHYNGKGFPIQADFDSISSKTLVIDWTTNKPIAEVDVNEAAGHPSAGLKQMSLALSPDGKYLAILLHHTLNLYLLP